MKDLVRQLQQYQEPPKLSVVETCDAYQRGRDARLSGEPEPQCPYAPGTKEYTQFAEGFCDAKPLIIPDYIGLDHEK